jgi:hypothetical protein
MFYDPLYHEKPADLMQSGHFFLAVCNRKKKAPCNAMEAPMEVLKISQQHEAEIGEPARSTFKALPAVAEHPDNLIIPAKVKRVNTGHRCPQN